jgi:hypothetical protein
MTGLQDTTRKPNTVQHVHMTRYLILMERTGQGRAMLILYSGIDRLILEYTIKRDGRKISEFFTITEDDIRAQCGPSVKSYDARYQ